MKEDSEMVLSPVQGDKERHNRGRRVWSVHYVPGRKGSVWRISPKPCSHTLCWVLLMSPLGPGGKPRGWCLAGHIAGDVVALGLNPTRRLPETTTLFRLPMRAVLQAFWALGWHWGCPPSEVVLTISPCPLLPQSYTPTVFERLNVDVQMKGKPVTLQIWDTAGGCAGAWEGQGRRRGPRCWEPRLLPSF